MIPQLILVYFYSSSMFHMHCVDMSLTNIPLRLNIMRKWRLFSCMTHPYSWFGLLMTHPYMFARPIRTVASGELSPLRVNLQLLRNFSSMVFDKINSHMYNYEVTHRDIVLRRQTTMLVSCSQCFLKGCICFISVYFHFSFQRKFNNHLKILTTTSWSTISRFYHCYFILRWNVLFFTFLFSTRKRLIRFHFFFLQDVW